MNNFTTRVYDSKVLETLEKESKLIDSNCEITKENIKNGTKVSLTFSSNELHNNFKEKIKSLGIVSDFSNLEGNIN
jgi:hypothetical protein